MKKLLAFVDSKRISKGQRKETQDQAGRQRQWVAARAQLVYLAREWSGLTTKELGRRLHRDASMISRLYG